MDNSVRMQENNAKYNAKNSRNHGKNQELGYIYINSF